MIRKLSEKLAAIFKHIKNKTKKYQQNSFALLTHVHCQWSSSSSK